MAMHWWTKRWNHICGAVHQARKICLSCEVHVINTVKSQFKAHTRIMAQLKLWPSLKLFWEIIAHPRIMAHGRSDFWEVAYVHDKLLQMLHYFTFAYHSIIVFYQKWKKCGINHLKTWKKSKILVKLTNQKVTKTKWSFLMNNCDW